MLPDCVNVASLFIADGNVVLLRDRVEAEKPLSVTGNPLFGDLPLVALIDGTTASAAEVLAGALHDSGRAILVGERTFGKGSVQSLFAIDDSGNGIRLTTAYMLTPVFRRAFDRATNPDQWGIDPNDGWYVPASDKERTTRQQLLRDIELPEPLTPESLSTSVPDQPLVAAWRALQGKLATGEFLKTGRPLSQQQEFVVRKGKLIHEREELKRKLLKIEAALIESP
jgi:carboxyl-terminal processing protease